MVRLLILAYSLLIVLSYFSARYVQRKKPSQFSGNFKKMRASTFVVSRVGCIYAAESIFGVRVGYQRSQHVARRVRAARARGAARSVLRMRRRTAFMNSANDPSYAEMRSLIELFQGLKLI